MVLAVYGRGGSEGCSGGGKALCIPTGRRSRPRADHLRELVQPLTGMCGGECGNTVTCSGEAGCGLAHRDYMMLIDSKLPHL
jgi:hypothetical protein